MRKTPAACILALPVVLGSCTSPGVEDATTAATTATAPTTTIADEPSCEPGSFDETTELDGFGVVGFVDANVVAMTGPVTSCIARIAAGRGSIPLSM